MAKVTESKKMNLLLSCIGKRGYIADYFRDNLTANDKIIGTSNSKWTPGFEHCDKNYILPDIVSPEYIPSVLEVCERESVTGILSFFDPDVVELSKHYGEFIDREIVPVIPRQLEAEICFDKYKTYKFLVTHGFLTPKTFINYDLALEALMSGDLNYPVFVKPRFGFGSALTFKARNDLELNAFYHYAPDMIIQEELHGDPIDFDILNDLQGKVVSIVPWEKYRSRMGETEQAKTIKDQRVIDLGIKLANTLGHIGPLDADIFMDGEEVSILEINLRFGGGYPVSHLAGANFPSKIITMLRGEEVEADIGNFEHGTIMMKDNLVIGGNVNEYFSNKYEYLRNNPNDVDD